MTEGSVRVAVDRLSAFARDVFVAAGMAPEHAQSVAEILVWANLRGVDSHGVLRIPRYLAMIDHGRMNPRPDIRVARETVASALVDADRATGLVAMPWAMERAIDKARGVGVGWVLVRSITHAGAIGYYTLQAARAGMAGLAFVSSVPNMAYHGARKASIATSPLAIAVPGAHHAPLMLDMATAVVAWGKIAHARDQGTALPEGWALDREGSPTTDPSEANIPLPLGGPKGAGLSVMMECLISLMVGNPIISEDLLDPKPGDQHRQNGLVVAVDIAAFTDPREYEAQVDRLVEALKTLPKAEGVDEILVPGERGDRVLAERTQAGIPLPAGTWSRLAEVADRVGVAMPETV